MKTIIRLGGRKSILSTWQLNFVKSSLLSSHANLQIEIVYISTRGDRDKQTPLPEIGGKGVFTEEIDAALRDKSIDIAVHSLKDLPVIQPPGFSLAAICERGSPFDVLVSRKGHQLSDLPLHACIGTSGVRRAAHVRKERPDIRILDLRGNIDTRLAKIADPHGPYDAAILAHAGLIRTEKIALISEVLGAPRVLPAPGQGAIALQCLSNNENILQLCAPLHHQASADAVGAERSFLLGLGGGCSLPISAYGRFDKDMFILSGRIHGINCNTQIDVEIREKVSSEFNPIKLGHSLAQTAISQGALKLLEKN